VTRFLLATALSTLPAMAALADDFRADAPVSAVTVYPEGASITRLVSAELPAGSHRLLFPVPPRMAAYGPPQIRTQSGVALGATQLLNGYVTDAETLYSEEQEAAKASVEAAREAVVGKSNEIERAQVALAAADARIAFLASVKGVALDAIDPEALRNAAGMIGSETAAAQLEKRTAMEALRGLSEQLDVLKKALAQSEADLARLIPPQGAIDMLAVSLELDSAQTVSLEVESLSREAAWRADYDLRLTRGDDASVQIDRKAVIFQYTNELWNEVDLVLSTADPFARIVPSEPPVNQASIGSSLEKRSKVSSAPPLAASQRYAEADSAGMALEEPMVIVAGVKVEGISVRYDYPRKVTLSPRDRDGLQLALDTVTLDAEEEITAVPRFDDTAFLMARMRNTLPEPILPGEASIYRDGVFVGRGGIDLIPAGAEEVLSFGPLEALRLEWKLLNNDTGDRGIVSRSNTREQAMEFTVENLSAEPVDLTALFALPYSEQEDLELDVEARPRPTREDHEKKRGLGAWDMELAAGQKQVVRIDVTFDWPTGSGLNWQP